LYSWNAARGCDDPIIINTRYGGIIMSTIGTFTPAKDGGWTGSIRTLVTQPLTLPRLTGPVVELEV